MVGDLETALLLLGASSDEGGSAGERGGEEDGTAGEEGEEAAEILQEAGRVARALAEDLERWQVRCCVSAVVWVEEEEEECSVVKLCID
jgi:hypothetical protein